MFGKPGKSSKTKDAIITDVSDVAGGAPDELAKAGMWSAQEAQEAQEARYLTAGQLAERENLQAQHAAAQQSLEDAQARWGKARHALDEAEAAQAQRAASAQESARVAREAAAAAIGVGDGAVSDVEEQARFAEWKLTRERETAEAALAPLRQEAEAAQAAVIAASTATGRIEQGLARLQLIAARGVLLDEWAALEAQLQDLTARSRAHNQAVNAAAISVGGQTQMAFANGARVSMPEALVLPGQTLASGRDTYNRAAERGYLLRMAPDLTHPKYLPGSRWADLTLFVERGVIAP